MPTPSSPHPETAHDRSPVVLLLIDVINDLDFPEGKEMLPAAIEMAKAIAALKKRAKAAGVACVYVNDNFGQWRSDFRKQVEHCRHESTRGRPLVDLLHPDDDDYFILKPKHSGFYSTNLDVLLEHLGAEELIITGLAGNICVLFTANDAYMRDFRVRIPSDCTVSNTAEDNEYALRQMERFLKADIRPSAEQTF